MTNETKPRAYGIVNLTQYAFELVGAVGRLPESPQRDEVLKQAKTLRLDLATATRESLFDGFVSLEGLRAKLLAPREIQRDEQGWLTHPALPLCDEDVCVDKFLDAFGIESAFVSMEPDVDAESYEKYHERDDADCRAWTPTPPDGDGWVLLEIYDTEDGPYALYVREKKPETLRERWKREERERLAAHSAAPAALTDDEIVEIFYPLRTCSTDERLIALAVGRAIERRALAASSVEQPVAAPIDADADARECLMDVVSHHGDFEKACRALKDAASDDGNGSGASYWLHQIDVLGRMKAQAERALAAMVQPAPALADDRASLVERVLGMFEAWPKYELGPTDEPESQYRFGYNTALEDVLTALDAGTPTRRASSANETADGWAVFDAWFADAWARYEDKEVVSQIRAKTWALKAWRYLMARTTSTKEWEALIAERDAAILSTHRQAFCIEQCAAHIGPETPATINGLPLAVKRVVEERDAARASANETEAAGATAEAATLLRQARNELCLVEWENDPPNRVQTLFDRIEAYVSRTPAQAAEPVAIEQVIHQVWVEATSSWADVTPAYYAERQPSNRRRVYYAPQPAQADARDEDAYVVKRLSEALADVESAFRTWMER